MLPNYCVIIIRGEIIIILKKETKPGSLKLTVRKKRFRDISETSHNLFLFNFHKSLQCYLSKFRSFLERTVNWSAGLLYKKLHFP